MLSSQLKQSSQPEKFRITIMRLSVHSHFLQIGVKDNVAV